tara:strand:+ start:374 stop:562 length:189 start_codon:yes stop_codon:yes gene_type:complete
VVKLTDHSGNEHDLVPVVTIDWGCNPAEFDWATILEHEVIALGVTLANKRSVLETLKEIESV